MMHPKPGAGIFERSGADLPNEDIATLWARADERQTRSYRTCGQVLRLRCDSADYAQSFEEAFLRLRCDRIASEDRISEITFLTKAAGPAGFPALLDLRDQRVRVFDCEEVYPTQLFSCLAFIEKRMFPLDEHLILHGSVVQHDGTVTAIVGRTYSGKSTLGLRLALEPGNYFLSDEFCPIRLADGVVEPMPRCLGLRRQSRLFLAERGNLDAEVAANPAPQIDMDPGKIHGLCIGRGGPLRNIVILSGEGVAALRGDRRLFDLQFVSPAVLADLRAISGVRAVEVQEKPAGFGTTVAIEVAPGSLVVEEIIRVCRVNHKMELMGLLPTDACRPDFSQPPELASVAAMRGIIETARHLTNLGALEGRIGVGLPKLLDCLAGRLGAVRFFSLRPGPLEETSQLLQREVLAT